MKMLKSNATSATRSAATLMLVLVMVTASVLCCCFDINGQAMAASPDAMAMMSGDDISDHHGHADQKSQEHDHSEPCLESDCPGCASGDVFVTVSADIQMHPKPHSDYPLAIVSLPQRLAPPIGELIAAAHPHRGPPRRFQTTLVDLKVLLLT